MKEKSTDKYEAINKDATVGNKPKILIINPPAPKKDKNGKYVISINKTSNTFKPKRKPCSGCSRKRKRG